MALFDDLMAQAGYVQLSRFGLKLTPDGRIVQLSPRVLPLLDGSGGCRVVGWQEPVRKPALIVDDEPEADDADGDADEWEWQLALARAKAAAEEAARPVAPPVARPSVQAQPMARKPPPVPAHKPPPVPAHKAPPVPAHRPPPIPTRAAPPARSAPVRSASSPTIAVSSRPHGVPVTPATPRPVAPVAAVAPRPIAAAPSPVPVAAVAPRPIVAAPSPAPAPVAKPPTRTMAGSVPAPLRPTVVMASVEAPTRPAPYARRLATGTGPVSRDTRPMPTVAPRQAAFEAADTRVDGRAPSAPTPIRPVSSPAIVRRPVGSAPTGPRPQVIPPIRIVPRAVAR
jgi:hypothetical protein